MTTSPDSFGFDEPTQPTTPPDAEEAMLREAEREVQMRAGDEGPPTQSIVRPIRRSRLPASAPDRSPPHSAEAEEHVIACCLLDGSDTTQRAIDAGLSPHSFYFPANRLLYEIIAGRHTQGHATTLETLAEELKTRRQLEAVGGFAYLMQVTGKIPTTAHAGYFIEKVQEKHRLREIIRAATGVVERAYEFTGGLDEFTQATKDAIAQATGDPSSADLLTGRYFDAKKTLPKPKPIFTVKGTTIATPGNLVMLLAQAKAGKSAAEGGMISATMAPPMTDYDTLGFHGPNTDGHAVIHIDTELSPYDHQQFIKTCLRRVALDTPPPWLISASLTGLPPEKAMKAFERVLKDAKRRHHAIHSVFLDGPADLINSPNNEEEAFPLVIKLHGLAIEYNTCIVNILHMNPGSENPKGRGHLGSQLERKCESNITLEKDANEVTSYWGIRQRGKVITKQEAVAFHWSDDKQMHVTCAAKEDDPDAPKKGRPKQYHINEFLQFLTERPMSRNSLYKFVQEVSSISASVFRDLLNDAVKDGVITRVVQGGGFGYSVNKPGAAVKI